ncbi:MAG: cytochrome oxidase subunit [Cohnella sp.]|nr:cytochrome oxidase subunit [Cohnella sp.]
MHQKLASMMVLAALVLALAACGGGKNDNGANGGSATEPQTASQEIVIKATTWAFDQSEYVIPKDTPVKITLESTKGAHGVKVPGTDINLGPGKPSTIVTLKEGIYEFHCSIPCGTGHGKMVSKLVVK